MTSRGEMLTYLLFNPKLAQDPRDGFCKIRTCVRFRDLHDIQGQLDDRIVTLKVCQEGHEVAMICRRPRIRVQAESTRIFLEVRALSGSDRAVHLTLHTYL